MNPAEGRYVIENVEPANIYTIGHNWISSNDSASPRELSIVIPGPPDTPVLDILERGQTQVRVGWSESQQYPPYYITGYQLYLNGSKVSKPCDAVFDDHVFYV